MSEPTPPDRLPPTSPETLDPNRPTDTSRGSPPASVPHQATQYPQAGGGKAIASVVIGIPTLFLWCLPFGLSIPLAAIGLFLGWVDRLGPKRQVAVTGMILCTIGLILGIGGFILWLTGYALFRDTNMPTE